MDAPPADPPAPHLRPRYLSTLGAVLLVLLPASGEPWGTTGHRLITAAAVEALPPGPRALFAANGAWLAEHSLDPDLWRAAGDEAEGPNHFLDLDAFGADPFPGVPRVEAEHLARNGPEAAARGRLPWRIATVYAELVEAFRSKDPRRVLERAAVLAHYVEDAHVPLHAVLNHDGQLSGQTGVHRRWESVLVDRFRTSVAPVAAAGDPGVGAPVEAVFDVLLESFREAGPLLESDRLAAGPAGLSVDERYDDAYYARLFEREQDRVRRRLQQATARVAGLWARAWSEAGAPTLDGSFRFAYVRGRSRGVLLSLDGAAAQLMDDAVARGVRPALARLRAEGATAHASMAARPPKTAPSHAALYTGAWSDRNGISGNEVPVPSGTVLATENGFSSGPLSAEPLWAAAARQGLSATVASALHVFPFAPYLEEKRYGGNYARQLTLMDGYQPFRGDERVYTAAALAPAVAPPGAWTGTLPPHAGTTREISLDDWGQNIGGLLYDDPDDPASGFDTLLVASGRNTSAAVTLKPRPAAPGADEFRGVTLALAAGPATVWYRLFRLSGNGSDLLLYRTAPHVLRASRPEVEAAIQDATNGFVGNGASDAYTGGLLGPPLWKGGDGTAEARYLETVALVVRQFTGLFDYAHDHTRWDLLFTYLPYPDEALHAWLGRLDVDLAGHDPALGQRLRPFLDDVLRIVDAHIAHIRSRVGPDVLVAVAADHGQAGTDRVLRPNVVLRAAGLLGVGAAGEIDLARTRAVYFPGNSSFVLLNRAGRPRGIVAPEEEEAVRREVTRALKAVRDPVTGRPVVLEVVTPGSEAPGVGGPRGGDLYLVPAAGVSLSPGVTGSAVEAITPRGDHIGDPNRPEMQAAFAVAGPGVAPGARLGLIHQVDVAPTLAALLGIDPPKQATGWVLERALADPPRPPAP